MDAVEKMVSQILAKGQETTAKHLELSKINLHDQLEKELEALQVTHEATLAKSLKTLEKEHHQQMQRLESLARQETLSLKQDFLQRLFGEAVDEMNGWDTLATQSFCAKGIAAVPDLPGSTVILGEYAVSKLTAEWLDVVNAGKKNPLVFSDTVEPKVGGFIVSQGGIEYNFIFENLVQEVQKQESFAIAAVLFQER